MVEPKTISNIVTVAIVLKKEVEKGQFDVRASDKCRALEMEVQLPHSFWDLSIIHRQWVEVKSVEYGMQMYHTKVLLFKAYLKQFRTRSEHIIQSKARITMPFPVQHHVFKLYNLLSVENDCRVVYVNFNVHEDE